MTVHYLQAREDGIHWTDRLSQARTSEEIAGVVREFLGRITNEDWARLPASFRSQPTARPEDIAAYALDVVRLHCHDDGHSQRTELTSRLAVFFSGAALRLAQVARWGHRDEQQTA